MMPKLPKLPAGAAEHSEAVAARPLAVRETAKAGQRCGTATDVTRFTRGTAPLSFKMQARADGEAAALRVCPSDGPVRDYRIAGGDPDHYADFYAALARDLGSRHPREIAE